MNEVSNKKENENVMENVPTPQIDFNGVNKGTIAVEMSKAVAEAQGKLIIAKNFPRNEIAAYNSAITSCKRQQMASTSFYTYPRGGSLVQGVSIRFAEELARCWGNIDYGLKELSRDKDKSEMQAYAWDMETNTISTQNFTNPHYREVKGKMEKLSSDRDIYEINTNMGARRKRACILAVLPQYYVEDCINECKLTLQGQNDIPLIDRVRKMVVQFTKFGVNQAMIEERLGRGIESMTSEDFVEYIGIFNSLNDKQSTPADWFTKAKKIEKKADDLVSALDNEINKEN